MIIYVFSSKKVGSGGPLICGRKSERKVYGVTSWGINCEEGVGIYARVAFHQHWINNEINVQSDEDTTKNYVSVRQTEAIVRLLLKS